jgi:hypothetical protein
LSTASSEWHEIAGGTGNACVTILSQSAGSTTFEVTVPGIEITPETADAEVFDRLSIPGCYPAPLCPGRPETPRMSVLLAIPRNSVVTASVVSRDSVALDSVLPYPLQPQRDQSDPPDTFCIDREFYQQDTWYPDGDVRVINTGTWRDLDVANLQVRLVRANAGLRRISVASHITVTVTHPGIYPQRVASWMIPLYARYVDNFPELVSQHGVVPAPDTAWREVPRVLSRPRLRQSMAS